MRGTSLKFDVQKRPNASRSPGQASDFRFRLHAPKELPQPQVDFAFGLLNTNPLLIMFVHGDPERVALHYAVGWTSFTAETVIALCFFL